MVCQAFARREIGGGSLTPSVEQSHSLPAARVGLKAEGETELVDPRGVNRRAGPRLRAKATSLQLPPDVLEVLAWLETDGSSRWNTNLFAGSRIPADTSLARFYPKDTEASQFDALAAFHRGPHCVENCVDSDLGFHLGDVGKL